MGWEAYPRSIYEVLRRLRTDYGNPRVFITENGIACKDLKYEVGIIADNDRIGYMTNHLVEVNRAIAEGSRVEEYYH